MRNFIADQVANLRRKLDARWFLCGNHLTLVLLAHFSYGMRSAIQILGAIIGATATEVLAARYFGRFEKFRLYDRILSGLSIAFGLLLLTRSKHSWFYFAAGIIAVLSKYLIRRPDGRHIYNPTNFAIISMYALMPLDVFTSYPDEYQTQALPYFIVLGFGFAAVIVSRAWWVTLAYAAGVVLTSVICAPLFHIPVLFLLAPDLGIIGMIFMFLMITDPQTTPASRRGKLIFGFSVAVVSIWLRNYELAHSYFVALFIIVTLYQTKWLRRVQKNAAEPATVKNKETDSTPQPQARVS